MKTRLSALPAPALAGVVREKNARSAIAGIRNCTYDGADMIDLHLSCLEDTETDVLRSVIAASPLPVLALNYNHNYSGGDAGFTEEERAASLLRAVEAGAAGIDLQGYTFDLPSKSNFTGEDIFSFTHNNPHEVVTDPQIIARQCALIEQVHTMDAEVLLSCHPGIYMDRTQVVELALFLEKRRPDIIKIVTIATDEEQLLESFQAMHLLKKEVRTPVSYHASGKAGMLSRVVNPILGGQILFCVDRYSESSTFEQPDLRTVRAIVDGLKKIM